MTWMFSQSLLCCKGCARYSMNLNIVRCTMMSYQVGHADIFHITSGGTDCDVITLALIILVILSQSE